MRLSERDSIEDAADRKRHDHDLWRLFLADVRCGIYRSGGEPSGIDRDVLHDWMLDGMSVDDAVRREIGRQRRSQAAYLAQRRAIDKAVASFVPEPEPEFKLDPEMMAQSELQR